MKRVEKRMKKRVLLIFFSFILFIMQPLTVYATSISELKQQKKENEKKLGELNEEISELTDESKGIRSRGKNRSYQSGVG